MPVYPKLTINIIPACAGIVLLALSTLSIAKPWLSPNDYSLRADIQLLSDIGVIKSPVITWPLNWSGIKHDLFEARARKLNLYENQVRQRVLRRCKYETREGSRKSYSVIGSVGTKISSPFGNNYREGIQFIGSNDWLGKRFALNIQAATVADADDDKHLRYDGSYAAVVVDNWILSIGAEERWWGPGWSDSLLVGQNSRPIPAISIRRNQAWTPEHRLLSWIGSWHFDSFVGRLESGRVVANPLLLGMRFSFRPLQKLEVSLSRLSMFGGDENPTDMSAFFSALRGDDEISGQKGAVLSLSGIDLRYVINPNLALYGQAVTTRGAQGDGDLALLGVDYSLISIKSGAKGYFELMDADISGNGISSYIGAKYQNGLYYKGRPIGATVFGRSATMGTIMPFSNNATINVFAKLAELNGGDAAWQPKTDVEIIMVGGNYNARLFKGNMEIGLQIYSKHVAINGVAADKYNFYMGWQKSI
ncbi:MAG: capsule assembly Wzi family protein [Gammaproteobacteria bacterium]|nr:MAG: capsule assembly Wzi family protein [Gammaproteobacteria bacterium]